MSTLVAPSRVFMDPRWLAARARFTVDTPVPLHMT
jgi:hypothetical protein